MIADLVGFVLCRLGWHRVVYHADGDTVTVRCARPVCRD